MVDLDFAKRFSDLMEKQNIGYKKLTEMAQISKNNIGNYKKGQIPNATILYKLSQILGVSMEYLLTGKEATDLTPEEQRLVDLYRSSDDRGRKAIMRTAEGESAEVKSSTCRTG